MSDWLFKSWVKVSVVTVILFFFYHLFISLKLDQENFAQVGDLEGYRHDFLATNGFDVEGVDYSADVASMETI